jgi:hypothetical protein
MSIFRLGLTILCSKIQEYFWRTNASRSFVLIFSIQMRIYIKFTSIISVQKAGHTSTMYVFFILILQNADTFDLFFV